MRLIHVVVFATTFVLSGCSRERQDPPAPPPEPTQPAPGTQPGQQPPPPAPGTRSIVEVATEAGTFKTLLAALETAGLTDTLKGPGPFTVFAPTDEAFAKIPKAELDALLADKEKLSSVLSYHVVPGRVSAKDLAGMKSARTVNGQEVKIDTTAGVTVGGATVTKPDVEAANGVIHVIDTVMFPQRPGA